MSKDDARARVDGRAEATRRRLIEHGRVAFAERGHDGVSLQRDVLVPAGVSNGSFYHQFADKTELLLAVLEEAEPTGHDALAAATGKGPSGDPHDVAHRAFRAWFSMVDNAEDLFRIYVRERTNPDARVRLRVSGMRRQWVDTIAERIRDSRLDTTDSRLVAELIASLTYGVLVDYLDTPPDERAHRRAALSETLPVFVAGGVVSLGAAD